MLGFFFGKIETNYYVKLLKADREEDSTSLFIARKNIPSSGLPTYFALFCLLKLNRSLQDYFDEVTAPTIIVRNRIHRSAVFDSQIL